MKFFKSNNSENGDLNLTGNTKSKTLVVLKEDELTSERQEFLERVLKSVGLEMKADTQILPFEPGKNYSLGPYIELEKVKKVLVFGIRLDKLGINVNTKPYSPYNLENFTILVAHSLKDISMNKNLKLQLWNQLKIVFHNAQ